MLDQSFLDLDIPRQPVRWVVSVSSGASSAVAAERTMAKYGKDNVDLVFADTKVEDASNYRFLDDLEKRWGKKIIRVADGRTPEQVWDDKRIIPNDMLAPCTYDLKLKLIIDHVKNLRAQGYAVVMCVGMSVKDIRKKSKIAANYPEWMNKRYPGRLLATAVNWSKSNLAYVEVPSLWSPVDMDVLETVKSWGIKLPDMYPENFTSANCGGDCPKGGVKHWTRVFTLRPKTFNHREKWETEKRKDPHFAKYAMLTHRINGVDVPYPLAELRKDIEGRDAKQMRMFELQADIENVCSTNECGVGWDEAA
jgi:3'-phosphoadenosine 5'-phosphosulfate sulfotransferase (PAPS reductase)/FAD synthetase